MSWYMKLLNFLWVLSLDFFSPFINTGLIKTENRWERQATKFDATSMLTKFCFKLTAILSRKFASCSQLPQAMNVSCKDSLSLHFTIFWIVSAITNNKNQLTQKDFKKVSSCSYLLDFSSETWHIQRLLYYRNKPFLTITFKIGVLEM